MLKNTMKKTMRMIFLVISLMVLWLSNCLAYKVENGRVLYDLYDISVMTVTNGSEKYNHFYWCSGTDLAKKGKETKKIIIAPKQPKFNEKNRINSFINLRQKVTAFFIKLSWLSFYCSASF